MKRFMAAWTVMAVVVATGCVADVETGDEGGTGGAASDAPAENVGEAVQEIGLGTCLHACNEGGRHFLEHWCETQVPRHKKPACDKAVDQAVTLCRGICSSGMPKRRCENQACSDAESTRLENYCRESSQLPPQVSCFGILNEANGKCRKECGR